MCQVRSKLIGPVVFSRALPKAQVTYIGMLMHLQKKRDLISLLNIEQNLNDFSITYRSSKHVKCLTSNHFVSELTFFLFRYKQKENGVQIKR